MRALTGYPLWFGLVSAGLKLDENRSRGIIGSEHIGKIFALHHGSAQRSQAQAATWQQILRCAPQLMEGWQPEDQASWPEWYRLSRITGAVVAVATLDRRAYIYRETGDCEDWLFDMDNQSRICPAVSRHFAFGPVVYMLRDVRKLAVPVSCPGRLGFWKLPEDILRSVLSQLSEQECANAGA